MIKPIITLLILMASQGAMAQRQWTEADFRARRDVFLRQCQEAFQARSQGCESPFWRKQGNAQCHQQAAQLRQGCEQRAEEGYQASVDNLRRRGVN